VTTSWGVLNLHPPGFRVTELYLEGDEYIFVNDTLYADGRTVPPDLLRDQPEQNYLGKVPRAFGLSLMAIALLASLGTTIWVYLHNIALLRRPNLTFYI